MFTAGIVLITCGLLFAVLVAWIESRPGAGNDVKLWGMRDRSWYHQIVSLIGWRPLLLSAVVVLFGVAMIAA